MVATVAVAVLLIAACGDTPEDVDAPSSDPVELVELADWEVADLPLPEGAAAGEVTSVSVTGDRAYAVGWTAAEAPSDAALEPVPTMWELDDRGHWVLGASSELGAHGVLALVADVPDLGVVGFVDGEGDQPAVATIRREATGAWRTEELPLPPGTTDPHILGVIGDEADLSVYGSLRVDATTLVGVWDRIRGQWEAAVLAGDPGIIGGGCTVGRDAAVPPGLVAVAGDGELALVARVFGTDAPTLEPLHGDGPVTATGCDTDADGALVVIGTSAGNGAAWFARRADDDLGDAIALPADAGTQPTPSAVAAVPGGWVAVGQTGRQGATIPAVWGSGDGATWEAWTDVTSSLAGGTSTELTTVAAIGDRLVLGGRRAGRPVIATGPVPDEAAPDRTMSDDEWVAAFGALDLCEVIDPAALADVIGVDPATVTTESFDDPLATDKTVLTCLLMLGPTRVEVDVAPAARYRNFLSTFPGSPEEVAGLGDEATWLAPFLVVRADPHAVAVGGLSDPETATPIARAVLNQLPR